MVPVAVLGVASDVASRAADELRRFSAKLDAIIAVPPAIERWPKEAGPVDRLLPTRTVLILQSTPFFARKIAFLPENGCERVISLAEEKKYLRAASPLLRDVATIMLQMGLRPEEIFQLHAMHVHLAVRPAFVHIPEGKTPNARRDVPITEKALPVIRRRRARAKGGYLFPFRVGGDYDFKQPMKQLHPAHRKALRTSGIKPSFRIYDLRHTYGTRAIEAGTNPLTLAKLMGHADLKTTQRYVHLSKTSP